MTARHRNFNVAAILVAATFCAFPDFAFAAEEAPAADSSATTTDAKNAGATASIADLEARYRTAADHFTASRWKEAVAEFRKLQNDAKSTDPDDAAARILVEQSYFYLGESLIRLTKPTDAIAAFEAFVRTSRDEQLLPIAHYRLGEAHYLTGGLKDANREFESLLDAASSTGRWPATTPRIVFYLGDVAGRQMDHSRAAAWFGMFTAMFPDHELYEAASASHADALIAAGDRKSAWSVIRGLYETVSPSPQASYIALQIFEAEANHVAAAEAYERYLAAAGKDDPRREVMLYESAWNLRKLNRLPDAAARFAEVAKSHPKSKLAADAGYRAAGYELSIGHHAEATKLLAAARLTADDQFKQHIHALELQVALTGGDRAAAEAAADKLVGHEVGGNRDFWKAEIAYRFGDWDVAADRFAEAVTSSDKKLPWFAISVRREIESLAQAGRWADVITAVKRSRELLPKDSPRFELDYLAGRAYAARAEFREAREAYALVLADARSKGTETAVLARFMTAETHFHQRDYAAALADYAPVAAQSDFAEWRAAALLQSGKCQEQLGRAAEAKQHYERVIAEFADSPYAADAARRRDAALRQAEAPVGNVQRK